MNAQKTLREELSEYNKISTIKKQEKMVNQGKLNVTNFWKLKASVDKSNGPELYDTITENDERLQNAEETKEYVANYFEQLYQARLSKPEFQKKTSEIENRVSEIEDSMKNNRNVPPFTNKELMDAIKRPKRNKATGQDDIPNELFIESNGIMQKILLDAFIRNNKEMKRKMLR